MLICTHISFCQTLTPPGIKRIVVMKKILFLIPTLGFGGAERVLVNLVNHLDKDKYEVTVQTLFDVGIYQKQISSHVRYKPGFKYYYRGNTQLLKLFNPQTLYSFFIRENYDLIVSYLEGSAARILSGCSDQDTKKMAWIHIEQETAQRAASSFRSVAEANRCYSRFDRIVAVSESVLRDFNSVLSVDAQKAIVYNVIESDSILSAANEEIDDLIFDPEEINIVSVAKLMKTKGYDRLIRVLPQLEKVHLYLIGQGSEQGALEHLAKECGVSERVTFVGFRENPYKYVKKADFYVCSSRREGISTAVAEALIVGTPVVSTDCSGAKELLGANDEYGIVVENSEEGIYQGIRTMMDEKTRNDYKKRAAERGKSFMAEQRTADAERLIDEVLAE